jgi:hypothetical protein
VALALAVLIVAGAILLAAHAARGAAERVSQALSHSQSAQQQQP